MSPPGNAHLTCVYWKGQFTIAHRGQLEGTIDGPGYLIYVFLSIPGNIENLKKGLEKHVYEVDLDSEEDLLALKATYIRWDAEVLERSIDLTGEVDYQDVMLVMMPHSHFVEEACRALYPSLDRKTSASVLEVIAAAGADSDEDLEKLEHEEPTQKKVPIENYLGMAVSDGHIWIYVVNIDDNTLEIYTNREKGYEGHRFWGIWDKSAYLPCLIYTIGIDEVRRMKTEKEFYSHFYRHNTRPSRRR
ncbi:hypothetical protein CVT24_004609 [Panaeolus cyanescens]|uniref:Uncharacterized protein n=1 Tax=Panaeolus cyanescens TaxID=181874 RepID=A0A409YBE0_9AGAR|nr:hypothetical protein CVT24_004609 [Panaeolus cyanescens]